MSSSAGIQVISFNGWSHNLRLSNSEVEVVLTLDVGPRLLSYAKPGGLNPLKVFEDQAGSAGESAWRSRGGHRLWVAPEDKGRTYFPDNAPVDWEQVGELQVRLTPPPETRNGIQKQVEVTLDSRGTGVTLVHRITCVGSAPIRLSPWAITVMAAGGTAIVPHPQMGRHPEHLLPNRSMVLWPYTDMSDPRWSFGQRFIRLRQDAEGQPTKVGLAHQVGWCGYLVGGVFFLKRYPWQAKAVYPDMGCNFEMFTNSRMLELESLGPLQELKPQQSVEHVERWELNEAPATLDSGSETELEEFINTILGDGSH